MNGLSLFSNIGIGEALLDKLNLSIAVANDIDKDRCEIYKHIYPKTKVITGDIRDLDVGKKIIYQSKKNNIDFIIATPPCQGMSSAGKMIENDERNLLIYHAVQIMNKLKPKYILIENIPQQLRTTISINSKKILIPEYIKSQLRKNYEIYDEVINCADYGVPQIRKRSILLLTRKKTYPQLTFLKKTEYKKHISLKKSIGHLPSLDPKIKGSSVSFQKNFFPEFENKQKKGLKYSDLHYPPTHQLSHIECLIHTPEGKSALENKIYFPKKNGKPIKGYKNTYKRQSWNRPAFTITTYNGSISSHDNVHPGRKIEINNKVIYSDPRVLTILELFI